MLHSLHLCLCGKPHPFRLHTQSLVLFVEPIINFFQSYSLFCFPKKATVPYTVLNVYHLNGLSNVLMFLASLQEPLTSNIQKKPAWCSQVVCLNLTSESAGMFSCERQQLVQSSLQALVLYLTVTAYFAYSYFIKVVLLLMYHFLRYSIVSFHIILSCTHLYTVSSFWALAHCALSRHHIFPFSWERDTWIPPHFSLLLIKGFVDYKTATKPGFFF